MEILFEDSSCMFLHIACIFELYLLARPMVVAEESLKTTLQCSALTC